MRVRDVTTSTTMLSIILCAQIVTVLAVPVADAARTFTPEHRFANHNDWEPTVAADPSSSYAYMATTHITPKCCPYWTIEMRVSSDSGSTWGPAFFPCGGACAAGMRWQADPVLQIADNGTVYLLFMNRYSPGTSLTKSSDHGSTWTVPVPVAPGSPNWNDKPWMVISPDGKDVYVAFNHTGSYVVTSHDYGATFSPAIKTSSDGAAWYAWSGTMTPNGNVYFAEGAYVRGGAGSLDLVYSTNGGASWNTRVLATTKAPPACYADPCPHAQWIGTPTVASDSAGTLVFAFTKSFKDGANNRLFVKTSSNGTTWSDPALVSDRASSEIPMVAAGPVAGDFSVAWVAGKPSAPYPWNTYIARSTDSGATWSARTLLSDAGAVAPYKRVSGYNDIYGDYLGLTITPAGRTIAVWGEGQAWQTFGQTWFSTGA